MTVTNTEKLLEQLKDALFIDFDDVDIFERVSFRDGFHISNLITPTLSINHRIYITINSEKTEIHLIDTESESWFDWIELKSVNKCELGIRVYKYLKRHL